MPEYSTIFKEGGHLKCDGEYSPARAVSWGIFPTKDSFNRLPQDLLKKIGMDWYYDNVLSEGLTVTLGVGYGKTSILGEDTEEGHKAQIQIKTPDTFFGFEYGKYHRDGGTQTELRSMYEKKLGNFHAGFDSLLFDADTEVLQSDGFDWQFGGFVRYEF